MLTYALLSVFIIELCLVYFSGTTQGQTSLYQALINPPDFLTSPFYIYGILIIISLSAAAVITPGYFVQYNQWAMFGLGVAQLISYVSVIVQLWTFMNGNLVNMGGSGVGITAQASAFICSIIVAPLIIVYVTAMIEWTRFNQ
jgi:hypothetical protein